MPRAKEKTALIESIELSETTTHFVEGFEYVNSWWDTKFGHE